MVDNLTKALARVDETDNNCSQTVSTQTQKNTLPASSSSSSSMHNAENNTDSTLTKATVSTSSSSSPASFVEYQTKIVQLTNLLQKNAQDMTLCQINELGPMANQLTQKFNDLTIVIRGAIQTCSNREFEYKLKIIIQELGKLGMNTILRLQQIPKTCFT